MIGVLVHRLAPAQVESLILAEPSSRYIDDAPYIGGFSERDIADPLDTLARNYLGWSRQMAPVIMGHPDRPERAAERAESFCRTDPAIAEHFARTTSLADNRADLSGVRERCVIQQFADDPIATQAVGD